MACDRVVVAPWGDPWGWSRVRYRGLGDEVESRSTLPLVAGASGACRAVVVVQESLLAANRCRIVGCKMTRQERVVVERGYPDAASLAAAPGGDPPQGLPGSPGGAEGERWRACAGGARGGRRRGCGG